MKIILSLVCLLLVYGCSTMNEQEHSNTIQQIDIPPSIDSNTIYDGQIRLLQTEGQTNTYNQTNTNALKSATTQNSTNTQNNTSNNTTNQQVPQTECQKQCTVLNYYNCTVCYDKCTTTLASSSNTTFKMNSCESKKCAKYKSQAKDQQDPTSKVTQCSEWETESLSESQCTQTCCNKPDYNAFTIYTWYSCVDVNTSKTNTESLIGTIIGSVLGGLLAIVIFLVIFCCWKDRIAVCCKNCCWSLENTFTDKYVTKAMRKRETQNKDTRKAPQSQMEDTNSAHPLDRSQRRWTKIKRKSQVSQLPTSKYIIKSQYDINPEIYCAICLDDMIDCKTSCDHSFHFECLRKTLKKKLKCPQCDGKSFNPLKITCNQCKDRETTYSIDKKNVDVKHPNFYHENKIICDKCLNHQLRNNEGSMERI